MVCFFLLYQITSQNNICWAPTLYRFWCWCMSCFTLVNLYDKTTSHRYYPHLTDEEARIQKILEAHLVHNYLLRKVNSNQLFAFLGLVFLPLWLQNITAYSFAKSDSFEAIQVYHSPYLSLVTTPILLSTKYLALGLSSYLLILNVYMGTPFRILVS